MQRTVIAGWACGRALGAPRRLPSRNTAGGVAWVSSCGCHGLATILARAYFACTQRLASVLIDQSTASPDCPPPTARCADTPSPRFVRPLPFASFCLLLASKKRFFGDLRGTCRLQLQCRRHATMSGSGREPRENDRPRVVEPWKGDTFIRTFRSGFPANAG